MADRLASINPGAHSTVTIKDRTDVGVQRTGPASQPFDKESSLVSCPALDSDLSQLSREDVNITRWINTALSHLEETSFKGDASSAKGAASNGELDGQLVTKLFTRVHGQSQEVGSVVEDLISQTLARLPRTTLELNRMLSETEQLNAHVTQMHGVAKTAAGSGTPSISQLRASQEKLQRCADMLETATRVEATMRMLASAVVDMKKGAENTTGGMDTIANAIHSVQSDLIQLDQVDERFRQRHKDILEQYGLEVEKAVERECLEQFLLHNVERASKLFGTLYSIGRVEALLHQYAKVATAENVTLIQELLRPSGDESTASPPVVSPSMTADLVEAQLIPSIQKLLITELMFLLDLSEAMEEGRVTEDGQAVLWTECTSAFGNIARVHVESSGAGEPTTRSTEMLLAITYMIDLLRDTFHAAMSHVLRGARDNRDVIRLYDATRHLIVVLPRSRECDEGPVHVPSCERGLSRRAKVANQITSQALNALLSVFKDDEVIEAFSAREIQRMKSFIVDSHIMWRADSLAVVFDAFLNGISDLLHFFPEKTFSLCVTTWCCSLTTAMEQMMPTPNKSQSELLDCLSAAVKVVRPALRKGQHSVDAFLLSDEVQQRYPSSAGTLLTSVKQLLWVPLCDSLELCVSENQKAIKASILKPVLQQTSDYTDLPIWRDCKTAGEPFTGSASYDASYTQGQVAPSQSVRSLGEAIMEIPLSLESLRGDGDHAQGDGLNTFLDEVSEAWLDDIVRQAVSDFVGKVRGVRIDFSGSPHPISPSPTEMTAVGVPIAGDVVTTVKGRTLTALHQLKTDLDYLRNILSAVSEQTFADLEDLLQAIQAFPPPTTEAPVTVEDIVNRNVGSEDITHGS